MIQDIHISRLMLGALIPPIGIGLSAVIAKMTKKGKEEFDQQLLAGGFQH